MRIGLETQKLTEEDVKHRHITPAIHRASWKKNQIKMEYYFTDGRIKVNGIKTSRGKRKFADYLLLHKPNLPLAIIEAKGNKYSIGDGMQQAIEYATILDIPFAYSSNGDRFLEHDMKTGKEREISLYEFPSPEQLWKRFKNNENIDKEQENLITYPFHYEFGGIDLRYYQRVAVNRTINAIAKGQNRILLVMATGFKSNLRCRKLWILKTIKT